MSISPVHRLQCIVDNPPSSLPMVYLNYFKKILLPMVKYLCLEQSYHLKVGLILFINLVKCTFKIHERKEHVELTWVRHNLCSLPNLFLLLHLQPASPLLSSSRYYYILQRRLLVMPTCVWLFWGTWIQRSVITFLWELILGKRGRFHPNCFCDGG